jgi:hypothetical protein
MQTRLDNGFDANEIDGVAQEDPANRANIFVLSKYDNIAGMVLKKQQLRLYSGLHLNSQIFHLSYYESTQLWY